MVVAPSTVSIPESTSAAFVVTVTLSLYQPATLGLVVAVGLSVGAVASRLIVTDWEAVPPPLVAEQVTIVPVVSTDTVVEPQLVVLETVDCPSETVQVTVTLEVYQPLLPSVPWTSGVMTGGVVSVDGVACILWELEKANSVTCVNVLVESYTTP